MADKDLNSLPDGPKDLCFNKNDFVKTPFSVDEFLQNQRKNANLEIMRDDLGIYLKVLRSAMIELINKDYADFVNLSSNLIGLDKAINKIQVPLGQLKEEVWQVKSSLDEAITDLTSCLEKQHLLHRSKRNLHSLTYLQQSILNLSSLLHLSVPLISPSTVAGVEHDEQSKEEKHLPHPDVIERVASELNQLHFRIGHCGDLLAPKYKEQMAAVESFLAHNLDELFLRAVHISDLATVRRCLCVYESLGKTHAAEELFQKRVVAKELHSVISEISLQTNSNGLKGIYAQVLNFVTINMKILLDLTSHADSPVTVNGFHFIVNSFWPEVEKRLELHLSSIFAPGNPDNFFQNYTETQKFLSQLEEKCEAEDVKLLHQHSQYQAFAHLWNLPVYFQIRFQEIGGSVEMALHTWSQNLESDNGRFLLMPTNAVWSAIQQCWNPNIFLPQISHRFWKLTLQVIARFYTWTGEALNEKTRALASGRVGRVPFLVWLFSDIGSLTDCLPEILDIASDGTKCLSSSGVDLCKSSLKESADQLLSRLPAVTERIVSEVSGSSGAFLRQVSDIPRLFRRTNRDVPTKPCSYMSAVIAPIHEFHIAHTNVVSSEQLLKWLTLICSSITCQLYACVSDVLTSVQKTEESLRRLKKMRDRATNASMVEGRGLTDDDKIRMQLALDVNTFRRQVEELGVKTNDVERLNDLISLVESSLQAQQQGQGSN